MQTTSELDLGTLDHAPTPARSLSIAGRRQWSLLVLLLLIVDALAIGSAFAIAYLLRFKLGLPMLATPAHSLDYYSSVVFVAVPAWLVVFATYRLYNRHLLFGGIREYTAVINACTVGMVIVIIASFFYETIYISRGWLLLSWAVAITTVGTARFMIRRGVYQLRRQGKLLDTAIVVGANEEARALAEHLCSTPIAGLRIVGAVDDAVPAGTPLADGAAVLGKFSDLENLAHEYGACELLVAPTAISREDLLDLCSTFARRREIHLRMSSGLFEVLTTGVSVKQVAGMSLISPEKLRITGIDAAMKSTLDYAGAVVGLVVGAPLIAIIAILIKLHSPGPVFHRRLVLGREGRLFHALKFRTMVANADDLLVKDPSLRDQYQKDFKLKCDPRVTRVGRFLRRTSLDELPQLVNVLLGQMSLVGPRMIAPEEASRYGKWRLNLLTVKPGITGPWQVNGRNELSYDQRVRLSMHYIRNYTIWLDLQILVQTVQVVCGRKGAY